ncbi:gp53-like domain-containing protein [Dialister succinatiphilus]|uniref:gp53-like domain-containing protein n=1 Tax=Dialister succinatiphilus TaxID=487173 RepID=UPI003F7F7EDA
MAGNTFLQGGVVYTNTTFPIAFSSCLAIEVTAYGTANTQNNLRVTANSNTWFSFYTNNYTPRYLAVGY